MDGVKIAMLFSGFLCTRCQPNRLCCLFKVHAEFGLNPSWTNVVVFSVCFSFTWWLQTEPCRRDGGSGWARCAGMPTTSRAPWTHNLLEERWRQPGWQRWTNYSKRWLVQYIFVFRATSCSREFSFFSWYHSIPCHVVGLASMNRSVSPLTHNPYQVSVATLIMGAFVRMCTWYACILVPYRESCLALSATLFPVQKINLLSQNCACDMLVKVWAVTWQGFPLFWNEWELILHLCTFFQHFSWYPYVHAPGQTHLNTHP